MKFKILTKEQIIISLDRLTRFKNTREKYLRVYSDILISSLIEPKLRKIDIENMDFSIITEYVSEIFNASLNAIKQVPIKDSEQNKFIQLLLANYENSVFLIDEESRKLLNNRINYSEAIDLISEDSPVNLKWLKELKALSISLEHNKRLELSHQHDEIVKELRNEKSLKFPIEEVILVEGITEEILLPAFAKFLGYDFYNKGVQVIPAGGKNQVVKMYYKLANELKIPIFVLLDKDAEENISQIKPKLRIQDRVHLVSCGEFEDLLPRELIIKTINSHFRNFLAITALELDSDLSMVKILEELFKTRGLHEFKKAEFAKLVRDNIESIDDISPEIKAIIEEISFTNKMLDSKFCS